MTFDIVESFLKFTLLGAEWVLWLLLLLSVLSVAVMFDRIFYFLRSKVDFSNFSGHLSELLAMGAHKEAIKYCGGGKSLEQKAAALGLETAQSHPERVEALMESLIIQEKQRMERGLVILGTLGNNAPFIGLFGTVLGIIKAFHDLAMNPDGGPSVVMAGVSEALVATAVGILVAIPAVVAFNFFNRSIKKHIQNAESLIKVIQSVSSGQNKKI